MLELGPNFKFGTDAFLTTITVRSNGTATVEHCQQRKDLKISSK